MVVSEVKMEEVMVQMEEVVQMEAVAQTEASAVQPQVNTCPLVKVVMEFKHQGAKEVLAQDQTVHLNAEAGQMEVSAEQLPMNTYRQVKVVTEIKGQVEGEATGDQMLVVAHLINICPLMVALDLKVVLVLVVMRQLDVALQEMEVLVVLHLASIYHQTKVLLEMALVETVRYHPVSFSFSSFLFS